MDDLALGGKGVQIQLQKVKSHPKLDTPGITGQIYIRIGCFLTLGVGNRTQTRLYGSVWSLELGDGVVLFLLNDTIICSFHLSVFLLLIQCIILFTQLTWRLMDDLSLKESFYISFIILDYCKKFPIEFLELNLTSTYMRFLHITIVYISF